MPTNAEWVATLKAAKDVVDDKDRRAAIEAELKFYSALVAKEAKAEKAVATEAPEKR